MKEKYIHAFMDVAERFAELSYAERLKVGSIVIKDNRIISIGYNGMPMGWDNDCEHREYMDNDAGCWLDTSTVEDQWPYQDEKGNRYRLVTKPEVLHAEANALTKLAGSHESGKDATLFCTHSPCINCAKLIYQSGITNVYYKHDYRSTAGTDFLHKSGIRVNKVET